MINKNWFKIYNVLLGTNIKKNIYEIYNELNKCFELNKIQNSKFK